jgi:hypothetical protein
MMMYYLLTRQVGISRANFLNLDPSLEVDARLSSDKNWVIVHAGGCTSNKVYYAPIKVTMELEYTNFLGTS